MGLTHPDAYMIRCLGGPLDGRTMGTNVLAREDLPPRFEMYGYTYVLECVSRLPRGLEFIALGAIYHCQDEQEAA